MNWDTAVPLVPLLLLLTAAVVRWREANATSNHRAWVVLTTAALGFAWIAVWTKLERVEDLAFSARLNADAAGDEAAKVGEQFREWVDQEWMTRDEEPAVRLKLLEKRVQRDDRQRAENRAARARRQAERQ